MGTRRRGYVGDFKLPTRVWLTRMRDVAAKPIHWLWPERLPLGKVTLLVGDPGRGKSLLALDMAARVTRGAPWPDQVCGTGAPACAPTAQAAASDDREQRTDGRRERADDSSQSSSSSSSSSSSIRLLPEPLHRDTIPDAPSTAEACPERSRRGGCATSCAAHQGSVVVLSAEDDVADTIRPRFEAAGGDVDRVAVLRAVRRPAEAEGELMFSLAQDVEALEAVIRKLGEVRLVVMDPVSAYMAGTAYNNEGLRKVLTPLKAVAERTAVAVVAISHLTKKADAALLYRTMGSMAYVAAARAVWAVGPDPEAAATGPGAPRRMLFLPVKTNLTGGATGLAYRIVPSPGDPAVPVLAWEPEPVALTAEEGLGVGVGRPSRRETAAKWLEGLLSRGPLLATEVERMALAAGISGMTLRRARHSLGVVSFHDAPKAPWLLSLRRDEVKEGPVDGTAVECAVT